MIGTSTQEHIIYDFDTSQFPQTDEDSKKFGKDKVNKQREALNFLIDSSFQDVFSMNMTQEINQLIHVAKVGELTIFMYSGVPFLELGDMHEEELFANGSNHLIMTQDYRVL